MWLPVLSSPLTSAGRQDQLPLRTQPGSTCCLHELRTSAEVQAAQTLGPAGDTIIPLESLLSHSRFPACCLDVHSGIQH